MTSSPTPSTLFTGNIWCPVLGDTDALAVVDGQIVATGEAARSRAHQVTEVVDITDGLLIPAFADGHAHPLFGGLEFNGPQVRDHDSVDSIVAEVRRWADEHPQATWIRGGSYDSSLSPEGLFDARWLDKAVRDRPVVLHAWDYHTLWVNTRALEIAGITAETSDPELGQIPRRPDGSPLGTLREWGAMELVTDVAEELDMETQIRALESAAHHYAALGVTWVQDAWIEPASLEVYLEAARADRLPIRFNLALYADPRRWPDQLESLVEARRRVEEVGHPHLTAHTVKFFADGVVENGTAAVLDQYCGCPGDRGMLVWEPARLAQAVTEADRAGFQPHLHAIGDRAVRVGLDAIEAADRANGRRDRRAVLAHVQLIDEADRERLARLDVIANAEPLWAQLDSLMTVLTVPRLGEDRSATQYPWASLREGGAVLSFGSDWPVSSADPIEGMAVACSRQTVERDPAMGWTPHERLSVHEALHSYTKSVAHQAFRDAGSLAVGCDADLVLLSADPRNVAAPRDLDKIVSVATWLGGRRITTPTRRTEES